MVEFSASQFTPKAESAPVFTCTYYKDGRMSSKTLDAPGADGIIYYHYLDENRDNQGYGRMDKSKRQTALNGELSYTYTYYQDSKGRLQTKKAYSDSDFSKLVETYTYNNDSNARLYSKVDASTGTTYCYYNDSTNYLSSKTLTSPDPSGMIYYHYLDENRDNQGYGRVDKQIHSDGTILIPGSQVTGFMRGSTFIILGTSGDDNIKITENISDIVVTTSMGGMVFTGAIKEINVYSFDGNDTINVALSVLVPVKIYAGSGNDQLFANNVAENILDGGPGNDLLVTINDNKDILIGGSGLDSFWCDTSDVIENLSADEVNDNAVHQISRFYQPFTINPNSPSYISLILGGQNLPDPVDSGTTTNVSFYPLFDNGMAYYNDIKQGSLGDCYFLAGLSSFALQQPDIILQSIAPLGDGTYAVRFYNNGVANYLRIDGDIPISVENPTYAGFGLGTDTWAMLLEKAFALFRYSSLLHPQNTYNLLTEGYLQEPFTTLTGLGHTDFSCISYEASEAELYNSLQTQLSAGYAVTLGSYLSAEDMIIPYHAYSLHSIETVNGAMYATVYNPWGIDGVDYDSNPFDGLLTITISELQRYFYYACASLAVTAPYSKMPYLQL